MTRLGIFSEGRGGIARTAPGAAAAQNIVEMIDALSPVSHWRLNESAGANFADRLAVANMAATGSPQRLTVALVDNDLAAACIAPDGVDDVLIATNPASKPYDVTAGAMGVFVQPDTSTPIKQHLMNRDASVAGAMALEYLSGGQVRFWRRDGTNVIREVISSIGAAPAGDACLLVGSWGAAGLKLHRNGVLLGTQATTNWAVDGTLNANVIAGRWSSAIGHFDGVMAHAFFLGAQPSNAEVNALATHVNSIAWAEDIDAQTVAINDTVTISLKSAGAHFKAPIVPSIVLQGSLGTTSVNGEALDYEAAGVTGFNDGVIYRFTSANGAVSQDRGITIDVIEALEFPLTQSGTAGWVSTTHSAFGGPSHGAAIENLPNVADGATLFTQASAPLRGTWDSNTLDVALIRSNGTQYYTKAAALALPSLVIVCGVIDADAGGVYRAWSGALSTQTPAGDAQEDAWTLNNSNTATMRGLVAASGGIAFGNVPQRLNEKILVVMEVTGNQLTVWQNGVQSVPQTISGTRISADGAQALLAKYYNDTIAAIMKGGIAEFYQNTSTKTKAEIRALIEYFQGEFWPSGTAPATASVSAGDFAQGSTTDVHILAHMAVAGIDTTGITLASIHEQPGNAGVSVSVVAGQARVSIASGTTLGATSFVYCVEKAGLVGFGTCSLNVTAASATNSIPLTPPAGTTFWVAPGGTGNGNSVNNPAGSWIDVLNGAGHRAVVAGDTIAVRGGSYFNERGKTITGKSGTSGSPIRIVGYHPDGQTRPRIDNSHPDFRGGSPSNPLSVWQASGVGGLSTWETVGTGYTSVINALQAYGDPRDGELRFCGYQTSTGWDSMRNTAINSYGGPGVFKGNGTQGTNGRLYISTAPAKFASESGENFPLVTSGGARNPNHMDLKLVWQADTMLTLSGCSHLHFFNHEWFYSRTIMKLSGTCTGLKFHYVEHRAGFRGYQLQGTISNCIWQWCRMFHGLPVTFQWRDAKSSAHPFGQYVGGTYEWGSEAGSTLRDNYWLNCTFERAFDVMIWLEGDVKGQKYLNCDFIYCRDDNIDHENSIAEEETGYCRFFGCMSPYSWRGGNDVPGRPESELRYYVHHCIFHCIYSLYQRSLGGTYTSEPVTFIGSTARVPMSISTEHSGAEGSKKCRNFAHCTMIYGGSKTGPTLADRMSHWNANQALTIPGWSMNNIIVCKFWDCIGYDVVDEFMRDGDCLHHITPSSGRVIVKNITDRSWTKSFSSLSAAVGDSQVQTASDPLPYPGGGTWMQNAIVADPQMASQAYDLVSQPAAPYAGSVYKPANSACHSGARNLSSLPPTVKWGTAANPTRSYSYEAWRGAVNPSGDGSEIGPQPLVVQPAS